MRWVLCTSQGKYEGAATSISSFKQWKCCRGWEPEFSLLTDWRGAIPSLSFFISLPRLFLWQKPHLLRHRLCCVLCTKKTWVPLSSASVVCCFDTYILSAVSCCETPIFSPNLLSTCCICWEVGLWRLQENNSKGLAVSNLILRRSYMVCGDCWVLPSPLLT